MIEELLTKDESKTLEFKENTQSLQKIVQTIIAFANTAGGTLIVGVKDKTKEVIGLTNVLQDEEKIANAIADSVAPLLIPTFHPYTWRNRDVLIVEVSHSFGPFYLKSMGPEKGTFMRLGSTNRIADAHTILEIEQLKEHKHFDEQFNADFPLENIDFKLAQELFKNVAKKFTEQNAQSLGLVTKHHNKKFPTNGAILLLGKQHRDFFPDAIIRLGRFLGTDKTEILDHVDLEMPLSTVLDPILMFIRRHTSTAAKITATTRRDIPQYSPIVVREAVINALLHADYSIKGASITIAIFNDRMEITNPGSLPYGLSLEAALSGVSQLRNRVIGRVFRELNLIEQWGSGLGRMIKTSIKENTRPPKFEEIGNFFRTTIYYAHQQKSHMKTWYEPVLQYLKKYDSVSAKKAQQLWKVTARTASTRLKAMCDNQILIESSTSPFDPYKSFQLRR